MTEGQVGNSVAGVAILVALCLFLFRPQIASLFPRITRAQMKAGDVELNLELDRLKKETTKADAAIGGSPVKRLAEVERRILDEASRSPRVALILLDAEIQREIWDYMATTGFQAPSLPTPPLPIIVRTHGKEWGLPDTLIASIEQFWRVRDALIHGYSESPQAVRAIDSGLVILRTFANLPRETNVVAQTQLTLFADAQGQKPIPGVWGLLLETTASDGTTKRSRVFPTSRTDYKKGDRVAWEFSDGRILGQTWYREPQSNVIVHAWEGSMEFVGDIMPPL